MVFMGSSFETIGQVRRDAGTHHFPTAASPVRVERPTGPDRIASANVPNTLAAVLLQIGDLTGIVPHPYFESRTCLNTSCSAPGTSPPSSVK
jgi:hypothetical protein